MKGIIFWKALPLVLAISLAIPPQAHAAGGPFDDAIDDFLNGVNQVIGETDMVVESFGATSKVGKNLRKGKAQLEKELSK